MPIYDYQCSDCNKVYDVFHKVREVEEDIICPACNSTKHVRLISAPTISTKGSGSFRSDAAPPCADSPGCDGSCGLN